MITKKEKKIIKILKNDGVGVIPTDTIYGLVGSAFSKKAINRIYKLKKRNKKKKLIILISSVKDLKKFGINLPLRRGSARRARGFDVLNEFWPHSAKATRGKPKPVSIILGGTAFRLPAKKSLIKILQKTGPLVAPSANPEGMKPAGNIQEAKKYFGPIPSPSQREGNKKGILPFGEDLGGVDFYLSGGTLKGKPSKLIKIEDNGKIKVLR